MEIDRGDNAGQGEGNAFNCKWDGVQRRSGLFSGPGLCLPVEGWVGETDGEQVVGSLTFIQPLCGFGFGADGRPTPSTIVKNNAGEAGWKHTGTQLQRMRRQEQ